MERWILIGDTKHPIDTEQQRDDAFAAMRTAGLRAGLIRAVDEDTWTEAKYLFLPEFDSSR